MTTLQTTYSGAAIALYLLSGKAPVAPGQPAARADPAAAAQAPDRASRTILSLDTAAAMFGADSFLMQTARGRGDQVEVQISGPPEDEAAFRAQVLAELKATMGDDADFNAALRAGKVEVMTPDEVPELNLQPLVTFTILRDGNSQGGGGFHPKGTNVALYEEWGKTWGQNAGVTNNSIYYARWPTSA